VQNWTLSAENRWNLLNLKISAHTPKFDSKPVLPTKRIITSQTTLLKQSKEPGSKFEICDSNRGLNDWTQRCVCLFADASSANSFISSRWKAWLAVERTWKQQTGNSVTLLGTPNSYHELSDTCVCGVQKVNTHDGILLGGSALLMQIRSRQIAFLTRSLIKVHFLTKNSIRYWYDLSPKLWRIFKPSLTFCHIPKHGKDFNLFYFHIVSGKLLGVQFGEHTMSHMMRASLCNLSFLC